VDLVTESLTTLSLPELRVIAGKADSEAERLKDYEPGYSCVWRALSLSAERAMLARKPSKHS